MIKNVSKNTILAENAEIADNPISRAVGLLKYQQLDKGQALVIRPCNAIHTFFMRFAIDVIFLNRKNCVVKLNKNVQTWRMTWPKFSAVSVVELPVGKIEESKTEVGDRLEICQS
jgi:uncharacterized membrane protein (UPF0127 family)